MRGKEVLESEASVEAARKGLDSGGEASTAAPSSEAMAVVAALRSRIQTSVGQVVLAMINLPRYRHQTLGDLTHLALDPLLRDRVAIAYKSVKAEDGSAQVDEGAVAGIAIWASVSDEVDARIAEQVKAGAFPVRLGADDWISGDNV